jgi:hypothetical protein
VATHERISTGIERLDNMLEGKGFYRGSSILVSGTAGTGKSSLSATFTQATCRLGNRCPHISLEESPSQIIRNMANIGIDLQQWVKKGLLQFQTVRAFHFRLEMHDARTIKFVSEFAPKVVIFDPVSGLEFFLSDAGVQIADVYIGPNGMLTGSARVAQEARERAEHVSLNEEAKRQKFALECKRTALEGQIAALRAELLPRNRRFLAFSARTNSARRRLPWIGWRWAAAANATPLKATEVRLAGT